MHQYNIPLAVTTLRPAVVKPTQRLPIFIANTSPQINVNNNYVQNITELQAITLRARPQQTQNHQQYAVPILDMIITQRPLEVSNNLYNAKVCSL